MARTLFSLVLLFLFLISFSQDYEHKTALVIGNSNYEVSPLKNPVNDARDLSETLHQLGFNVITRYDLKMDEMKDALRQFQDSIYAHPGVALFYFSGHGMQYDGNNYLVPTDADIQSAYEVESEGFAGSRVLKMLEYLDNPLNIVILDACRTNSFPVATRGAEKGLAPITTAPTGSIVAYSTAPGDVASDGLGDNGLYTEELVRAIKTPGLSIEEVFKVTRRSVAYRSDKKQIPWENSSLLGDFYFQPTDADMHILAYTYDGPDVRSYDPLLRGAKDSLATNNDYAMVAANRALEFDGDNSEAYDIRHWTYKRMNMYKEAKADLDKAYELNPSDSYFLAYAYYYIDVQDYSQAIKYLNRYFLADPEREKQYWNKYTKAIILHGLGDELGAKKCAEEALAMVEGLDDDNGYGDLIKDLLQKL